MAISERSGRGTYAYATLLYERTTWVRGRGAELDSMLDVLERGESISEYDCPEVGPWIRVAAEAHRQLEAIIARRDEARKDGTS